MTAINPVSNSTATYAASIAVDSGSTANGSTFTKAMAAASAPSANWLTSPEQSLAARPNVKEFMDKSGAEFLDASEFIYGVVGSNTDVRDWSAIMASSDPVAAARQATAQMYGRTNITPRTDASYMGSADTLGQDGNFAVRLLKDDNNKVVDQGLKLVDAQGLILRDAGNNPQSIERNAWLFGFDTKPLTNLVQAASTLSAALADAVQVASTETPINAKPAAATPQAPASVVIATSMPIAAVAPLPSAAPAVVATTVTPNATASAQQDAQASAPELAQVIDQATTKAVTYFDSNSYLTSLYKG